MADKPRNITKWVLLTLVLAAVGGIALLSLRSGPRPESIESLQAKLQKEPANPDYHEQLANLLIQAQRREEALTHFRAALQYRPNHASSTYGLAMALANGGTPAEQREAWQLLAECLPLHPQDAAINEGLGDLTLILDGDSATAKAQAYYETAIRNQPDRARAGLALSKIYMRQNRIQDAGRVLVKPLKAHDQEAPLHLQMANILALVGNYERAAVEYNSGTARDPKNHEAYCAWGVMLIDAGKPRSAETVLRRAIDNQPNNAVYHVHLARALREQGLMKEALEEFTVALDKDNNCVLAYLELATTYQNAHNEKVAENFLRQGIKQVPKDLSLKAALAKFLTTAEDPLRRDPWEAATILQTCVEETNGKDISLLVGAAEAWGRVQLYDQSLTLIEKAIAASPGQHLTPDQHESLLWYRQQYLLALAPPRTEKGAILGVEGMAVHDPADIPWPFPLQPRVETLNKPLYLSQYPGPGSALDSALYTGEAVRAHIPPAVYPIGFRP